ncbi:aminotransferase, class I/II [Peptostreptococcaceae bacterium AS15]|nr:aminotransferase, class I/II [Peptostreptococcaceae bacterium AS15]
MISEKAKNISPSITMEIAGKVAEMIKNGEKIVNLTIGEPDFFTPAYAKLSGIAAITNNITKYDVASGNMDLKKAICEKLKEENGLSYDVSQIVVSNGAKQAITNAAFAVLNPDDEVLIPTPCWVSYPEIVKLTGAKPVMVKTRKENSFKLTIDDVKPYINQKTKMVILTNPNNPTGAVFTKDELSTLCEFFTENNITIMSDEIYESINFDFDFVSVASLSQKIYDNTILINGFSKSASMTGWRLGYSATSKELAKAIESIQSHLTAHPSTISQQAGIAAIRQCKNDVKIMRQTYKERRDYIAEFFKKWGKLDIIYPQGAFYVFIDISPLKDKLKGQYLSLDFCNGILSKENVALVPGQGFFEDNFVRLSYASSMETIKEGLERIKKYTESL